MARRLHCRASRKVRGTGSPAACERVQTFCSAELGGNAISLKVMCINAKSRVAASVLKLVAVGKRAELLPRQSSH